MNRTDRTQPRAQIQEHPGRKGAGQSAEEDSFGFLPLFALYSSFSERDETLTTRTKERATSYPATDARTSGRAGAQKTRLGGAIANARKSKAQDAGEPVRNPPLPCRKTKLNMGYYIFSLS